MRIKIGNKKYSIHCRFNFDINIIMDDYKGDDTNITLCRFQSGFRKPTLITLYLESTKLKSMYRLHMESKWNENGDTSCRNVFLGDIYIGYKYLYKFSYSRGHITIARNVNFRTDFNTITTKCVLPNPTCILMVQYLGKNITTY